MRCPTCGRTNRSDARFCDACGGALARVDGEPTTPVPRAYTPRHLTEQILRSRAALEGERKQVTVLFADIQGSLEIADRIGAEEWHALLDRFFQILADGIHRFGGTVNQYTGDGVMALFGAPLAHEDHARRACAAAVHLAGALRRYVEELKRTRELAFSVRMGLNSGEVVVGKIGDDLRMDYTAQGHSVGLAQRMEQLAGPDRIYLTEATADLVTGLFELRDLGLFAIKGVPRSVRVFELVGPGPLRTRLDVARARGFTRLVGRDAEMQVLGRALETAVAGHGSTVAVVGPAGVGKSRLCHEFVEGCRARGILVAAGSGVSHGRTISLLPVLELYRAGLGIGPQESEQAVREKIAGRYLLLDPSLAEDLPLVFEFLGVADPERPALRLDPETLTRRLQDLTTRYMCARSRREPAVLLLEDLHWFDAASEVWLPVLVKAASETRTLLLLNFRPEYQPSWGERPDYRTIVLEPLGERATAAMLDDLLGTDPTLAATRERIRARTVGNPFFTEEVVQALVVSGALEGERGAYRLVKPVDEIRIPDTVHAVLAARIDGLEEREKALLQTAAVIGREFSRGVLERVAGLRDTELDALLHALAAHELVFVRALVPEIEYAFKHPLTHEVAYASQLTEHRRAVHAAVAHAIETLDSARLDERAALLAHHWEQAGEPLVAARWHRRAAQWVGTKNFPEAARHWGRVRELVDPLPPSPERTELAMAARTEMLGLGVRLGATDEERSRLLAEMRALVAAGQKKDPGEVALLDAVPAMLRVMTGEGEDALDALARADTLLAAGGDIGQRVAVRAMRALAHTFTGRIREGMAIVEDAFRWAPPDPMLGADVFGLSPYILLRFVHAYFLREAGRLDEARRDLETAGTLARAHGQLELVNAVAIGRADLARAVGDPGRVLEHAREAHEAAEAVGSTLARGMALTTLGLARMLREEWSLALEPLERSLEILRATRTSLSDEPWRLYALAEVRLRLGDGEAALRLVDEAIAIARGRRNRLAVTYALSRRAQILLETGSLARREEIETALRDAREIADQIGSRSALVPVYFETVRLARLTGDDARARAELEAGRRLCLAMGASGHAARFTAALSLLRGGT
jgi:class 3 adenylate cyclase/tetratricopeptide (TPR) repeat protein